MSLHDAARIALGAAALLCTATAIAPPAAHASPGADARCHGSGEPLRFIVLFDERTPSDIAFHDIGLACGDMTSYYPQIGVAVASAPPSFDERIGTRRAYSAQAAVAASSVSSTSPPWLSQTPVDPRDRSAEQWDMHLIGADPARDRGTGSRDVLVGVLDSGVDPAHPDLRAAVDPATSAGCVAGVPDPSPTAWAPTTSAHGTHVAGIIAAADDGAGTTGVAPGVRVASIKVVDEGGYIFPEAVVCGLMWAASHGARVVNHSYSVDPPFTCRNLPGQEVAHEAVRRATAFATAHGVLSVSAIGNDRIDLAGPQAPCDVLPAELPDVVTVSAVGAAETITRYSSFGNGVVDITAPGGDSAQPSGVSPSGCVLSTIPGGYGYGCGTSMAAPHVTGVAGLLASHNTDASPARLAATIARQSTPLPCRDAGCVDGGQAGHYGAGLINARAAAVTNPG